MSDVIPNRELVVYALSLLGGQSKRIHTEDIALKCYELFPDTFSWTKYPQYPDKDVVRVALTDARKDQYGALVDGRTGQKTGKFGKTRRGPMLDGWVLTDRGIRWLQQNADRLASFAGSGELKEHRQKDLQQLARIKQHKLFAEYKTDPSNFEPMIGELADLLRCRVDAEERVWLDRLETVRRRGMAGSSGDVTSRWRE
jgi:hypothetical protein